MLAARPQPQGQLDTFKPSREILEGSDCARRCEERPRSGTRQSDCAHWAFGPGKPPDFLLPSAFRACTGASSNGRTQSEERRNFRDWPSKLYHRCKVESPCNSEILEASEARACPTRGVGVVGLHSSCLVCSIQRSQKNSMLQAFRPSGSYTTRDSSSFSKARD